MKVCTICGVTFEAAKTMTICKSCNSIRVKAYPAEYRMYRRSKVRAKENNREFNLDLSDIVIPEYCPVLGIKLECVEGAGGHSGSPSLDRRDSTKGYTKDNIQVISNLANKMKNKASKEELISFAKWVLETFGTE